MEVELFGVEQSNGEHAAQGRGAWKKRMAARCSSTRSATCRAKPRTRSCACWSIRPSSGSGRHRQGQRRRPHHFLHRPQSGGRDRRRPLPGRPLSPALGGADPGAAAVGAARGHSRIDRLFHGPDFGRDRTAETPDRPGRHGGSAVACLAGKRPPASQQRRTAS